MSHASKLQAAIVAAVLAFSACHATPPGTTAAAESGDAQASFEPRSQPGTGQQFLARMAGDWLVEKTIHRRAGGVATSRGTSHQEMVHDGRFLRCDFTFDGGGAGDSTGTGVIGFDAETGRFTSFWIDSRSTRISVRQSDTRFDGNRIQLGARPLGSEASARTSRTVTEFDGEGRIVHRQWTSSGDGDERLVMELLLTPARG